MHLSLKIVAWGVSPVHGVQAVAPATGAIVPPPHGRHAAAAAAAAVPMPHGLQAPPLADAEPAAQGVHPDAERLWYPAAHAAHAVAPAPEYVPAAQAAQLVAVLKYPGRHAQAHALLVQVIPAAARPPHAVHVLAVCCVELMPKEDGHGSCVNPMLHETLAHGVQVSMLTPLADWAPHGRVMFR